jgi:hypothetical protein
MSRFDLFPKAASLCLALALSGCANYRALRDFKPRPEPSRPDYADPLGLDLIQDLAQMHPHLSLESPRAKPGTPWQRRELIVWLNFDIPF